ncbi:hypothetical protein [Legionella sp. WA2022007384]
MKTAVIWSNIEYTDIPLGHIHQLDKIGISNHIILLSEHEYEKAHETQFVVFDDTEPQSIIEHYQSQNTHLKIQVLNTGIATTEEEKLNFYLKNYADQQYQLYLYLCKEAIPGASKELSAKPLINGFTKYSLIPFFTKLNRARLPLFQAPCSSDLAIKLMQNNIAPCLCYRIDVFDLLHYQWLFNIFVELISLQIRFHEDKCAPFSVQLNKLINEFNKNILALEKTEHSFETTHKKAYSTFKKPGKLTQWQHGKNVKKKEQLENNFPKLIAKLETLYEQLQENFNDSKINHFTQNKF